MRSVMTAVLALGIFAPPSLAQTPQPKPGPEQARIGYFVGEWKGETEVKPSTMGPGGKYTGTATCQWFAGGFHLVCHSEGTGPKGAWKQESITGFDQSKKAYTYYAINSSGEEINNARGTVNGKVWTWPYETKVGDKVLKGRVTLTEESPTSYTYLNEFSLDGGRWSVSEEGKHTKVK